MSIPTELYACLLVRELPAQSLLRLRTELRSSPCAVLEGEPPLQQVVSLNANARRLGVAHGMTKVEVETFPSVTILRRSLSDESITTEILLECAGAFSPRIEDRSSEGVFLCLLDIAGTEKMFGPPQLLIQSLLIRLKTLGVVACITVSLSAPVAMALAKASTPRTAKVIPAGAEALTLAPLPLTVLDLDTNEAETFSLWGIRTLGALAELPEKELIARMGQRGKHLRQLARGEMPYLFQPQEPAFVLQERMELDFPVELLDALLFVVNIMLEQLILRATARVLALASVTIHLSLEGGGTYSRTVLPALPNNDRQLWLKLLHLDLEAHPPTAAITAVLLEAEPGSTSKIQLGLFSPQLPEPSRLDVTLARIQAIVGEGNVGCAVLKDTNQLDDFLVRPFAVPNEPPSIVVREAQRAAMRMLRPAETARVTLQNQCPSKFVFRERRYAVEYAYGPWLTSGAWWASTLWGQEQWDLVARSHSGDMLCCCLVRDRIDDAWRMVALYD